MIMADLHYLFEVPRDTTPAEMADFEDALHCPTINRLMKTRVREDINDFELAKDIDKEIDEELMVEYGLRPELRDHVVNILGNKCIEEYEQHG